LLHNIVVREADDQGIHEIISGDRRYRAFLMLAEEDPEKYSTLPCKVEAKIENEFAEFLLLQANATSRDLTDYERAYQGLRMKTILNAMKANGQLKTLQEEGRVAKGRLRDAIAAMFDVSGGQVSRWESIFTGLTKDFLLEFKNEKVGIALAYDLSLLEPTHQDSIYAEYKVNGFDAIKDAIGQSSKAETEPLPSPVSIQDADFQEATKRLAERVNVQKQDHQQSSDSEQTIEKPPRTKPLIGTEAQYQSLLQLGVRVRTSLIYAKGTVDKAKHADHLEAFAMVADEFGFGRKKYCDDIDKMMLDMNKKNQTAS
jgi:hypothetical protein